jgi:putative SOS response-associated peptidase YedK
MPGRFALTSPPEALRAFFGYREKPDFPPRYNIAPTQPVAIVTAQAHSQGQERHFGLARWGFLPGFVKDPRKFSLLINARSESLLEKPSFRAAVKRRRCLVPADSYYEWRRDSARAAARPFQIRRTNGEPMGFAGLYETWSDPHGGEIDTACIITTPANRWIATIYDRMPAIIEARDFHFWLDNDRVEASAATALLRPAPEDALERIEIGNEVNRVGNDDAQIQRPVSAPIQTEPKRQGSLF